MSLNGVGAKQRYSPLKKPLLTCTSMGERNGGVLPVVGQMLVGVMTSVTKPIDPTMNCWVWGG